MPKLYPKIKAYKTKYYDVGNNIRVYVEFYGNPKGFPAIYLHGGPGDKTTPVNARLFNPKKYNIVLMDQRGCGKSTPGILHNTTKHLIQDMETIRKDIGADKWLVTGGSWGASLAMLYAQAEPKHTSGLILRGYTDLYYHRKNFDLVMRGMIPQYLDKLYKTVGLNYLKHTEKDMTRAYTKKLKTKNRKTRKKYLEIFCDSSDHHITSKAHKDSMTDMENLAAVNCHYLKHDWFLKPRQMTLEKNVKKIKHIPTTFVQGRFDFICPQVMAYEMHKRLPKSKLVVVQAGHTVSDIEVAEALVKASDEYKT